MINDNKRLSKKYYLKKLSKRLSKDYLKMAIKPIIPYP